MLNISIAENSTFIFSQDIELMFAAQNILLREPVHNLCSQVYGTDAIAALKGNYRFLDEVFQSFAPEHSHGMFEHLLTYPLKDFTLEGYRNYLLETDPASFIKQFLCLYDVELAELQEAVDSDEALAAFYTKNPDLCSSYLGLQSLFRQTKRYITEYFALAEELRTEAFIQALEAVQSNVTGELEAAGEGLEAMPPLEYSQQIMGKTFHNRGPYAAFTFSPSLFLPYRAIRFFGQDQILFFSVRPKSLQDEAMLRQLKALADSTRIKIVSLLGEKGALRGLDMVEALSLAPSTISHHVEQLKKAGLLHEEPVKNSKYYSINKNNVRELLHRLKETIRTE